MAPYNGNGVNDRLFNIIKTGQPFIVVDFRFYFIDDKGTILYSYSRNK